MSCHKTVFNNALSLIAVGSTDLAFCRGCFVGKIGAKIGFDKKNGPTLCMSVCGVVWERDREKPHVTALKLHCAHVLSR